VSDYCYSFPVLNRVIAQAERMDIMMDTIGVDPLAAILCDDGASWYEARTRCIDCAADRRCKAWLDTTESDEPRQPPAFCPNTVFFLACKAEVSVAVARSG
jgi:hypothetical protein